MNERQFMNNLVLIGCGNMGAAMIKALLDKAVYRVENLVIIEKKENTYTQEFSDQGIAVFTQLKDFAGNIDLAIIAVKPQDAGSTLLELSQRTNEVNAVLSIMAGVTIGAIEDSLPSTQIIRCMPNTPASIRCGMSVFCGNQKVNDETYKTAQTILEACGEAFQVDSETMIDAATAISGSGPGYVFYFAEALAEGAIKLGFDENQARLLASQTLLGSAKLLKTSSESAKELRKKVTSPGGTTEAAINHFESSELKKQLIDGFQSAFLRSLELAKISG